MKNADGIIRALNRNRRRGATESAFLTDSATRLNSKQIFDKYYSFISTRQTERYREIYRGYRNYLYY
nr:hypothetical protein [Clostridium botulinum]